MYSCIQLLALRRIKSTLRGGNKGRHISTIQRLSLRGGVFKHRHSCFSFHQRAAIPSTWLAVFITPLIVLLKMFSNKQVRIPILSTHFHHYLTAIFNAEIC